MSRAKKARRIAERLRVTPDLARSALSSSCGNEYNAIGYLFALRAENVPELEPKHRRLWNGFYATAYGRLLRQQDEQAEQEPTNNVGSA